MIRHVISDLGNVVVFFDNFIFFRKMAAYCPYAVEEITEMVSDHFDLIRSFDTGKLTSREFCSQVIKILNAEIEYDSFFSIYNDVFSLNPPVLQILKRLNSKYRLTLLSNTDIMRFGFIKERFPEILIFNDYVLSFEVGYMKPHPEIYMRALEEADAGAEESILIDDRKENTEAALNLGIDSILFSHSMDLEVELRKRGLCF